MAERQRDDERLQEAEAWLRRVRVTQFNAAPSSMQPFQRVVLTWDVTKPNTRPPIRLQLTGGGLDLAVETSGTRTVSPVGPTGYRLVASLHAASRVVATTLVTVDTSDCVSQSVDEQLVRSRVTPEIDNIIPMHPEVSRRREDRIEIEYDGLHVSLRLRAAIDNVADPDIDIDALIAFYAESRNLRYRLVKYSLDVDFPWWQDFINWQFFPAWLAAALSESNERSLVRAELKAALDRFVAEQQTSADARGLGFLIVSTRPDAIDLTLCPVGATAAQARPDLVGDHAGAALVLHEGDGS